MTALFCRYERTFPVYNLERDDQRYLERIAARAAGLSPTVVPRPPRGLPPTAVGLELDLEMELRHAIAEHRTAPPDDVARMPAPRWDGRLEAALAQALFAYETERVAGPAAVAGNEEFHQAIKRLVPAGEVFQGFPIAFTHADPRRILAALLRQPVAKQLLQLRAPETRHALRVRAVQYPEGISTVWVLLAAHYPPEGGD